MTARTCIVTVTELRGIRQSVEVTAETVLEAAARALSALRRDARIDAIGPRLGAVLARLGLVLEASHEAG